MKILLHICCSNCALYPVKTLRADKHTLTGFWFNPNIHPQDEYLLRLNSLKGLAASWDIEMFYDEEYNPGEFLKLFSNDHAAAKGDPNALVVPSYPDRCTSCYTLRLEKTAQYAKHSGHDAFTTTLLISPYQDFDQISSTGKMFEEKYNITFFQKDFRPHFRSAMELSKEMGLYRQNYCGCIFSSYESSIRKIRNKKT